MKSVSLSQLVRSQQPASLSKPVQSWRELTAIGLTLSAGLALIALFLMTLDPGVPAAWIIVPVLLGGSLPLFATMAGQFDVQTRFDAAHLVHTLDSSLVEMGYAPTGDTNSRLRHYIRPASLFRWKARTISLAIHEHAITIAGPLPALRRLQHSLSA